MYERGTTLNIAISCHTKNIKPQSVVNKYLLGNAG